MANGVSVESAAIQGGIGCCKTSISVIRIAEVFLLKHLVKPKLNEREKANRRVELNRENKRELLTPL